MDLALFYALLLQNIPLTLTSFALGMIAGWTACAFYFSRTPTITADSYCKNPYKVEITETTRGGKTLAITCMYKINGNLCAQTNKPCIKL